MNEKLTQMKEQILKVWNELDWWRRGLIIGSILAVMGGAMWIALAPRSVDYGVLFTDLDPEQGGKITETLRERGIPYKVTSGGSTIMVPRGRVYDLRLDLASKGITSPGGVGFELFDKDQFGVTDFVQKLNYRRALEGELGRTISAIRSIKKARVHLVLPEKRLFQTDDDDASASVVVELKPGRRLSRTSVMGIQNLVASAVRGLQARKVHIVDTEGNVLAGPEMDTLAKKQPTPLQIQQKAERKLENKLKSMLEQVMGKGKVAVQVSLEMDFTKKEAMEEVYNPDSQVARSEKKQIERRGVGNAGTKGIPGARANLPGGPKPNTTKGGAYKEVVKQLVNYEIDKKVTKIVDPVGKRKRISVAVIVDGTYTKDKKGNLTFKPLPREELDKLRRLVQKAVGYQDKAGDQVEVESLPFRRMDIMTASAEDAAASVERKLWWMKYAGYGLAVLLALVVLVLLGWPKYKQWKAMRARELAILAQMESPEFSPTPIKVIEEHLEQPVLAESTAQPVLIAGMQDEDEEPPAVAQFEQIRETVLQIVDSDPDRTVAVLRHWIMADAKK